jgi:murein DD-endopeptidase MepM/ murein hydrolase activator NlpD
MEKINKFFGLTVLGLSIAVLPFCTGKEIRPQDDNVLYWNLRSPLTIRLDGNFNNGNSNYSAIIKDGDIEIELSNVALVFNNTNLVISVFFSNDNVPQLSETFNLHIKSEQRLRDIARFQVVQRHSFPHIAVITKTPSIHRGGSGVVVFEARDEVLDSVIVRDNHGNRFFPVPMAREGYYMCMVGWHVGFDKFDAYIIAKDRAGNASTNRIDFEKTDKSYPVRRLQVQPTFAQEKAEELGVTDLPDDEQEKYQAVTRAMAQTRRVSIYEITSRPVEGIFKEVEFLSFDPLKNHRVTSGFGLLRRYMYQGKQVRQSYHLGIDLASTLQAPLVVGNDGTVIFAGYNGGFGNTIVVDHGLGIYSLYSHCTTLNFKEGDLVKRGDVIATTGTTGYATGDHVHFSIIINGVYVDPSDWMDDTWISSNIIEVIERASRIIMLYPET